MTTTSEYSNFGDAPSPADRLPTMIAHFTTDRACLERLMVVPGSPRFVQRMVALIDEWQQVLIGLPYDRLSPADQVDWHLFRAYLDTEAERLTHDVAIFTAISTTLLPSALSLIELEENRRAFVPVSPRDAAARLDSAASAIQKRQAELADSTGDTSPVLARQAARLCQQVRAILASWFGFYHGYDPLFDWWVTVPYQSLDTILADYERFLFEKIGGAVGEALVGEPIGRDALVKGLQRAQIPYTPEELIVAAYEEREWCLTRLRQAAHAMGLGDDWRQALELVKSGHVEPGEQPALVRDLAQEAIAYVETQDLVTVPPVARECWRMEMMAAERQKVSPFFLGGEEIIVSFPTDEMTHAQKMMSLRGNNRAFARATVHHELIPGHHLQFYCVDRFRPYRQLFMTPFWIEGWTLHWEMLLWERNFARTPEEQIGMLFWRLHRAARVVFSLEFHCGQRTADECVEMLVNDAGHERNNAIAEVRRSFGGDYDPLYQCAYLIGGWQMHALYRELVIKGTMTERTFHDAVLRENAMPIPTLRAALSGDPIPADFAPVWHFTLRSDPEES